MHEDGSGRLLTVSTMTPTQALVRLEASKLPDVSRAIPVGLIDNSPAVFTGGSLWIFDGELAQWRRCTGAINAQHFTRAASLDPQEAPRERATPWARIDLASGHILTGKAGLQRLPNARTNEVMTSPMVTDMAAAAPAAVG